MTGKVLEAVHKARKFFEIEAFPGDLFLLFEKSNAIEKYKLLLFKEDIDKLSGFIGYGKEGLAVVCVNYKRSYGHQNYTLAHEIGHWFLHKGQSISDDDTVLSFSSDFIEQEANDFARELLYPEEYLVKDFYYAIMHDLFQPDSRARLGNYINELCHRYCLSYELVLRSLLYKNRQGKQYRTVRKEIEKSLEGKVTEVFDKDFYKPNDDLPQYQQLRKPYEDLKRKVDELVEHGKIGVPMGEAIKLRNGIEIN